MRVTKKICFGSKCRGGGGLINLITKYLRELSTKHVLLKVKSTMTMLKPNTLKHDMIGTQE